MVRILVILCFLTSCSSFEARKSTQDKMRDCVFELVGQHGVSATEATKSCRDIYRRK